jgi:hypothetical protein
MRNIYCWRGEAMMDAGFWMLDTGLALKFHLESSIQHLLHRRFIRFNRTRDSLTVVGLHENWTLALKCSSEGGSVVKTRDPA